MTTDLDRLQRYSELCDALSFAMVERDDLMRVLRRDGKLTLATLAEASGLSVQRVHQITGGEQ